MDLPELERVFAQEKIASLWSGFEKRQNQANFLIGVAQLTDVAGVYIPGLTLEIEVKPPIVVDRGLVLFTLRKRLMAKRIRAYQLEVCPADKRSHNGDPVIYGPHEHLLDEEARAVTESDVNYDNWDSSLQWFLRRINVRQFEVARPW